MSGQPDLAPHEFWQAFQTPTTDSIPERFTSCYPARLGDGRTLLLPIRTLPHDSTRGVASLILNQASFEVLDGLASLLAEQLLERRPDVVIGIPTLGLPLAEAVARRLGHARLVALSTSRKFWYDEQLSEPLSSITTPAQAKRLYLDPRSLALIRGRRVVVIDDVLSTGSSMTSALRLLARIDQRPAAIGVAMAQTRRWVDTLSSLDPNLPSRVHAVLQSPALIRDGGAGWRAAEDGV